MFKCHFLLLLVSAIMGLVSCSSVPITGRQQLILIPDDQVTSMSFQQYRKVIRSSKLSQDEKQLKMIRQVGKRIAAAVQEWQKVTGHQMRFEWEFQLIVSDQVNAWCMPGGKVAFYTGILPICEDEAGVAVVMGHEVAHALARHGNERMSQALIAQVGMAGLSEALAENDSQTRQLWMSMAGLGVHYGVMLPFGRNQESEADRIGLILMAKAGYDPREAPRFWERMAQSGGSSGPAFMSTHPSHDTRISRLKKLLPEAMLLYRKADTQ